MKLHTLLDLRGAIPTFIHISDGKMHDVNILDLLVPEPRAFYVMDRAYLDFERLYRLHQAGSFFCNPSQVQLQVPLRLFQSGGSKHRPDVRPTGRACGFLLNKPISNGSDGYATQTQKAGAWCFLPTTPRFQR